jgi:SAM-dependent methyltransferase
MGDNWYETYFGEEYLRLYAAGLTPEREAAEVDAIVAVLGLEPGAAVLDLCCGQGRHLVPLAQRGYTMTGLDLSEYLLGLARRRAESAGVAVEFHQGDMREIPWAGRFDAVINMFTAFGYFDDEAENQKVLHGVHRALKPGGRFLIETMSRDRLVRIFLPNNWEQFEDGTIAWYEREFDFVTGINTQRTTYRTPDGALHHRGHRVRVYTPTELYRMLREAGLEPVSIVDGDGSPFTMESRRMMILSVKEGH